MKILDTYRTGQTGWSNTQTPGIVQITDVMPEWNQREWRELMARLGIQPDPKPFQPGYKMAVGTDFETGRTWPMQSRLFADGPTTDFIARRYGTGATRERSVLGEGGTFAVDLKAMEFQTLDGRWVNVGMIASFYTDNPEDLFPGVADHQITALLARGAKGQ